MPGIKDIILREKTEGEFFNTYQPAGKIGKKIFDSFIKLFNEEKGFPLSAKDSRCGTISNTMALSTILELEDMDVDVSKFDEGFRFLLKNVFSSIYKSGDFFNPEYDATPYLENMDELNDYVETASKILIIMIDLRNYANKSDIRGDKFGDPLDLAGRRITSYKDLAEVAEKVIVQTTEFLNDSVLEVKASEVKKRDIEGTIIERAHIPAEIAYRGWAFTHPKGDSDSFGTSIYFTYHATNAYVSLYNAYPELFSTIIGYPNVQIDSIQEPENLNDNEKAMFERNKQFVYKNRDIFNEFRIKTASSGRYIEGLLSDKGVDIAFDFVRSDLTGISSSMVIDTQESNAVINTLFILAIYLNAGVDEDYEFVSEQSEFVVKGKDWIYNQLQFALSNIKKIYTVLKVDSRQELVDSFSLSTALLREKYPSRYNSLVQQLRKSCKNVAVYDLIPLLCNTYTIVFEYLIKYPQREMIENLELIMENCSDNVEWLWGDANGFNINNNLYYVLALENFYKYYEEYEEKLSGNNREYNRIVKARKEEYEQKLKVEIDKLNELKLEKENLEVALKQKRSNLDKEVEILAENKIEELFEGKMIESLANMLNDVTKFYFKAFAEKLSPAQAISKFKNDEKLRVALAIFSSIDFSRLARGTGDIVGLPQGSLEFENKMKERLNEAIVDNVEINDKMENNNY